MPISIITKDYDELRYKKRSETTSNLITLPHVYVNKGIGGVGWSPFCFRIFWTPHARQERVVVVLPTFFTGSREIEAERHGPNVFYDFNEGIYPGTKN